MNNSKMTNEEFLNFYVQYCAARLTNDIDFPAETGPTDDWVNERMKRYTEVMSNQEFLDFIDKIKSIAGNNYRSHSDAGFVIFGITQDAIMWRDTIKKLEKCPNSDAIAIDLNDEEERRLIKIVEDLREGLTEPHKYRASSLIRDVKGEI